jgi:hypothetical protein
VTVDSLISLFDAFRQFGPEGMAISSRYNADGALFQFLGVGALYDPGPWFVAAEWGTRNTHSAIGDRTAWYAGAGCRFGKLTPYALYSQAEADGAVSDPGLTLSAFPPARAAVAATLNAALNRVLARNPVQETVAGGVRWDFAESVDLKVQFDRSRLGTTSHGTLGNVQPGFKPGGSYNLVSIAVDFVF